MKIPDAQAFLSNYPLSNFRVKLNYNLPLKYAEYEKHPLSLAALPSNLIISQANVVKSLCLASFISLTTLALKKFIIKPADSFEGLVEDLLTNFRVPTEKIELILKNKQKILKNLITKWTDRNPYFNLTQLEEFNAFVKQNFSPDPNEVTSIINQIILDTTDQESLCYLLVLSESFSGISKMYSTHLKNVFGGDFYKHLKDFKLNLYRDFAKTKLEEKLAKYATESPPAPPPITGDEKQVAERKRELLTHLSTQSRFILSLTDNEIEDAARKLAKCTWALDFYEHEMQDLTPYPGYSLIGLTEEEATEVKKSCITSQTDKIKEEIMNPLEKRINRDTPSFVPKLQLIEQCRLDQLRDLSRELADWQNLLKDTIIRKKVQIPKSSNNFYSLEDVPAFKGEIKGGLAVKRDYLPPEHGEECLDYDELKNKMEEMDYTLYDKNFQPKFKFTSREEIEAGLEEAEKFLEPYRHMDPKEYLDMFVKNSMMEWDFTMAAFKRRKRREQFEKMKGDVEEDVEKQEPPEPKQVEAPIYSLSKRDILADSIYFLSKLEHIKWCYLFAHHMPITAMETIKHLNKDSDNPPPPSVKFTGPKFKRTREWIKEYLKDENSVANTFRKLLDKETEGTDELSQEDIDRLNAVYVKDDPEILTKDAPLLAAVSATGGRTAITSKLPDPLDGREVYERMQKFLPYRLNREKPNPQAVCNGCGFTIFKIEFRDKSGEFIVSKEFADLEKGKFKCPVCNTKEFTTVYPTGKAGLSKEAQEAINEAHVFPEDYEDYYKDKKTENEQI